MADLAFPDRPGFQFPGPPPKEVLEYFRRKGYKIGFDYRDVWREEHAVAFTVAKAMEVDILMAIRAELDKAMEQGRTYHQFAKDLKPTLQALGWWGRKGMVDPVTGAVIEAQLGSPQRLKIIYDTNLRTARAAGQWERIQRSKDVLPYLLYTVGPSREHRLEHLAWHGVLLPADDPWWITHFVPNGWNCRCRIRQVSQWEYDRIIKTGIPGPPAGSQKPGTVPVITQAPPVEYVDWVNKRTGKTEKVPKGIDPGWDYNPGAASRLAQAEKHLQQKQQPLPATPVMEATPVQPPTRTAWQEDFPDVLIQAGESAVKKHPLYPAAKAGDREAAARLVAELVSEEMLARLQAAVGGAQPIVVAVQALEEAGVNVIPQALAGLLAARLGLRLDAHIVQINRVGRTGSSGYYRLTVQPLFAGQVEPTDYLLVDDFIGQGGTLANLKGHIEAAGGRVRLATALTGKPYSAKLAPTATTLANLRQKHDDLESWWREHFGYDFEHLTESEARYLFNSPDADTIRNRILAEEEKRGR